jgi:hypothetical protein
MSEDVIGNAVDVDNRAERDRASRNRPITKYVAAQDTVTISSEVVTTDTRTGAYQWTRQSYRTEITGDTPLAFYRFQEMYPAVTMHDETGAFHGTYTTGALLGYDSPGNSEPGRSADFSGTTNAAVSTTGAFVIEGTAAYTLEAWLKPAQVTAIQLICGKDSTAAGNHDGAYLYQNTNARISSDRAVFGGGGVALQSSSGVASTGVWIFAAVTYDGTTSTGAVRLYVNGVALTNGASTGSIPGTTAQFSVGSLPSYASFNQTGQVTEVATYTRALSSDEILSHYNAMTAPSNPTNPLVWGQGQYKGMRYRTEVLRDTPTAYWRFNEYAPAATANDASTNLASYAAIPTSNSSDIRLGTTGAIVADPDTSIAFSTTHSTGLRVASSTRLDELSTAYTLEAWIYPTTTGTLGIVGKTVAEAVNTQWQFALDGSPQVLRFRVVSSTGGLTDVTTTGPSLNAWHHIAATFSYPTLTLYMDGSTEATATTTFATMASGTGSLFIGHIGSGAAYPFNGRLDEVAVYPSALSTARLYDHYLAGTVSS